MARLNWAPITDYEIGLDRGVCYGQNGSGEVWNGLISVDENSEDSDEQARYSDGVKTHYRRKVGYFAGTIEAFTYPDSFYESVFVQRRAKVFGLSYRVLTHSSYKIHLVYNVMVMPSSLSRQQDEAEHFSWDFTTMPVSLPDGTKSAHFVIDASIANAAAITALESLLYGSDIETPRLPMPEEILTLFEDNATLRVTDNGDGTFTVTGPDSAIQMLDSTTFQITWPSAVSIDADSYRISSL